MLYIKSLEESGIVSILPEHSGHGNQKVCHVNVDRILVDVYEKNTSHLWLATSKNLIGEVDDPRYFAHPKHKDR